MPGTPRMNAAKSKLEAKKAASKNLAKSKKSKREKNNPKPETKKPEFKYEYLKSTSEPDFKLEKEDDDLKLSSPGLMTGSSYDKEQAYNKDLSGTARLHFLENSIRDKKRKYDNVPFHMEKETPMYMYDKKSPLEKELVGKQENLPAGLKAKIEASPVNMSDELKYGGPVIDQMKTLSQEAAGKVLRHSKSKM